MSNWFCPTCGQQCTGRSGNAHEPGDKPLLCYSCEQPKEDHTPEQLATCAKQMNCQSKPTEERR